MKPDREAEVEAWVERNRDSGRGTRLALGLMFGVETGVMGAIAAVLTGGLWSVGALIGTAVTGILWAALLAAPVRLRARVGSLWDRSREAPEFVAPDPRRVYRSASIEGTSLPRVEKKPYWPEG